MSDLGRIQSGSKRTRIQEKMKMLRRARALAHHYMPKGYVEVEARDFLENPEEYGVRGEWVERPQVES